jgi:hypothetical protein
MSWKITQEGYSEMTQSQAILEHLRAGNVLTPIDALNKFHCFRLAARVSDLRAEGYNIVNEGDNKFAKYRLASGIARQVPADSFKVQSELLSVTPTVPRYHLQ